MYVESAKGVLWALFTDGKRSYANADCYDRGVEDAAVKTAAGVVMAGEINFFQRERDNFRFYFSFVV